MSDLVRVVSRALLLVLGFAINGSDLARSADVEAGQRIAEQYCARCHAIGREGESSHAEAPPFRSFGENWPVESLEEALAEGIVVGHPDMPEFTFEPEEISDLLAYLATLQ